MCSREKVDDLADGSRPLELIEREIRELAAQISAQTCRWLELVAEYDEREGWAQWGCRSCAHWVSWQCSIVPGAAREHVRVARRLRELPRVRAAFAAGQLSYSKVRALTRMENIAREQDLLDLARHATASQLERLIRAYRKVVRTETAARDGRPERWVTWTHDDDGSLLLHGRLPAEEGALVIEAIEAAVESARDDVSAETPDAAAGPPEDVSAETPEPTTGERRADALLALADTFLAAGPVSRSGGDRHQVVVHVDTAALTGDAGRCELEDGAPLAAETARRIACDSAIVHLLEGDGTALDVGRKTRAIPPALRRALAARDRGCRFPGCQARRHVDAHHIVHWAHGGPTRLSNLVQLCRHHHRLLHEGGYTLTRTRAGQPIFHRPDGRRIPACPTAPRTGPPPRRRDIDHTTGRSLWSGERLDLDLGVEALLAFAPIAGGEPPGV